MRPPSLRRIDSSQSSLVLALLVIGACLIGSSVRAQESSVRKAIRALASSSASVRHEAEALLKRLGAKAVPTIEKWLEEAETQVRRVRDLLANIDPSRSSETNDRDVIRGFFAAKLDEGWRVLREGDYLTAQSIGEALEALDGDSTRGADYRRLVRACRKRMLRSELLAPSVEFSLRIVDWTETPTIVFRLSNRQREQVVVQAENGVLGRLDVSFEHVSLDGSTATELKTIPVLLPVDLDRLVLAAKRSYDLEVPITLDPAHRERKNVVARVRVIGKFRPAQWGIGNFNISESLELPETECWVVPAGEKNLASDALRKLEVAIIFRDLEKLFVAGRLAAWAAEGDPKAVRKTVKVVVKAFDLLDVTGFEVADGALRSLTGLDLKVKTDRDYWRDWIARESGSRSSSRAVDSPSRSGSRSPSSRSPSHLLDEHRGP